MNPKKKLLYDFHLKIICDFKEKKCSPNINRLCESRCQNYYHTNDSLSKNQCLNRKK